MQVNPWASLLDFHYRQLLAMRQCVAEGTMPAGHLSLQFELVESLWLAFREHQGTLQAKGRPFLSHILRQPPKSCLSLRQQSALLS